MSDETRRDRPENDLPRREANPEERRDWEPIQNNGATDYTERLRIVGGYLYRTVTDTATAMVFVPETPLIP